MKYLNEKVAVGMIMMDDEGYDQMMVMHGTIEDHSGKPVFVAEEHEPFEMSPKWLDRVKPVEEEMGEQFTESDYVLLIGSLAQPGTE